MKQSEELQKSGAENGQQPGRADEKDSPLEKLIDVHSKALDDLVNVNSLFTIAVFIGLSFASPKQHSLENRPECDADPVVAKTLVTYEIRLGKLSCGSVYTLKSVISLTVLVSAALVLLYVPPVIFAFFARMKENSDKKQSNTV
ncbi:hypothetical protein CUMW_135760 [Citrus unshiu]|nr:hypothetical protein CUMW_135760 [Citrus unshiu]